MKAARYTVDDSAHWNSFVATAKNATFLHDRRYMDYHAERFTDHSLVVREDDQVIALLPASRHADRVVSHAGLTYGGLLLQPDARLTDACRAYHAILRQLYSDGIGELVHKCIPAYQCRYPSGEDEYALFLAGARLQRRDACMVISQRDRLPFQTRKRRSAKRATALQATISPSDDFAGFWREVLAPNLRSRFDATPVHSAEEITRLHAAWPNHIRLFVVRRAERLIAGAVIYLSHTAAHAQYISATQEGRELGALDLLFSHLICDVCADRSWFSLGTSSEDEGRGVNRGLIEWKEGFGARAMSHDTYTVAVRERYPLLERFET